MIRPVRSLLLVALFGAASACGSSRAPSSEAPTTATPVAAIAQYDVEAATPTVQAALETALGEQGFGVLFRADMGKALAKFADDWGDDYNRSGLEEIRAVLFCNPKYANEAANADPVVLALCPLSITLLQRGGSTTLLFERPTAVVGDSPARQTLATVEAKVIAAIEQAVAAGP